MNYELLVFHCNLIFLLQAGQEVNLIMSCLLTQMLGRLSGLNFEKDSGCLLKTSSCFWKEKYIHVKHLCHLELSSVCTEEKEKNIQNSFVETMIIKDSFETRLRKVGSTVSTSWCPLTRDWEVQKSFSPHTHDHILDSCTNIVVNSFQGPLIEGSSVKSVKPGTITFGQMAEPNFLLYLKLLFAIFSP